MREYLPVARPHLGGNEHRYVQDCLDTNWISSSGPYVSRFEDNYAQRVGVRHAMSCSSGTTALHLALLALGTAPEDEVIVPALSYVAAANSVVYCGASPIFVDSDSETWTLDPARVEALIGPRTRGIIAVHLYGAPADMDPILEIAGRHRLFVLEDAAESHGAEYKGRCTGSLGDAAVFSFFGNKAITTGEGGMVTTNRADVAERVRLLRNQGQDPERRYWFPVVGYNYRMTNIAAAIGLAQLEQLDEHLVRRNEIASWYDHHLAGIPYVRKQVVRCEAHPICWLYSIVLTEDCPVSRDQLMMSLAASGIESRPFFYPIHTLPPFSGESAGSTLSVAEKLGASGINLPTWVGMSEAQVVRVCETIGWALQRAAHAA